MKMKEARLRITLDSVGEIRKRLAGVNKNTIKGYRVMLYALEARGQTDLLADIKERRLSMARAYQMFQRGYTKGVYVKSDTITLAADAFKDWIDTAELLKERTKKNYRQHFALLVQRWPQMTVDEIPAKLRQYRAECLKNDIGRTFNLVKAICQSFAANRDGGNNKHSPLWSDVASIRNLPLSKSRKKTGTARSVRDIKAVGEKMPEKYRRMLWTMCMTGMDVNEYFNCKWYREGPYGLRIEGTKRANRNRVIPVVQEDLSPPMTTDQYLYDEIKKHQPTWMLADTRKTFKVWCNEAKIEHTHSETYMGHHRRTMIAVYSKAEEDAFLYEDGEKLRNYITRCLSENEPEVPKPIPQNVF